MEEVIIDKMTKSNDHDFYSQVFFEAIQRILPEGFIIRVETFNRMAIVYSNLQDYEKAFSYLEKRNALTPNILIYLYKTKIYYKQGQNEKAIHELNLFLQGIDKLLEKEPENSSIHYFKGLALEYLEPREYMINYYNGITKNLKMNMDIRKVFYNKVNTLLEPLIEMIQEVEPQNACLICQYRKINISQYKDRISGLENWTDGINSTVYYLSSTKKICGQC